MLAVVRFYLQQMLAVILILYVGSCVAFRRPKPEDLVPDAFMEVMSQKLNLPFVLNDMTLQLTVNNAMSSINVASFC